MRWLSLFLIILGGCASGLGRMPTEPVTWHEQRAAVLDVVPLGTPRDDVAQRLHEAGVEFTPSGEAPWTPGLQSTVFYCDRWSRPNGDHWSLDLALLFDQQGALYEVRRAGAEVAAVEILPSSPGPSSLVTE